MNDSAPPPRLAVVSDDTDHRTPPNDPQAEQAVLGLCLTTPQLLDELKLTADDFYQLRNSWWWQQLTDRHRAGDPISPTTVNAALMAKPGEYTRHGGGATYLFHLVEQARLEHANTAPYLARTLREHTRTRAVQQLGQHLVQLSSSAAESGLDHVLMESMDTIETLLKDHLFGTQEASLDGIQYLTLSNVMSAPSTDVPWLIAPIIAAGRVSLLYSPGKTGKSLIAMEAAAALATGRGALSQRGPNEPVHVLYVDQEMTPEDWQDRLIEMGYGLDDFHKLDTYLHLAQLQNWPPMDTPAGGHALQREAARVGAKVVIIDTVSKVTSGEENSNDTAQAFYRSSLVGLKREGLGVLILDHTGKDIEKGARGGSAKTDNIDLAFELLLRGKDLLTLRCSHHRFRDDLLEQPTMLRRQNGPLAHIVEHHTTPVSQAPGTVRPTYLMERISRYVEITPGVSSNSIETAVKGKRDYIRLALELLIQEGYIHPTTGARNSVEHRSITAFREHEETPE